MDSTGTRDEPDKLVLSTQEAQEMMLRFLATFTTVKPDPAQAAVF